MNRLSDHEEVMAAIESERKMNGFDALKAIKAKFTPENLFAHTSLDFIILGEQNPSLQMAAAAEYYSLQERAEKAEEAVRMFFFTVSVPEELVDINDPENVDFLKAFQAMQNVFNETRK